VKILSRTVAKNGRVRTTVELDEGEILVAINPGRHYSLGQPLEGDVLGGHILADATPVTWCSVEQKWVE
jgi:hypothetical protein